MLLRWVPGRLGLDFCFFLGYHPRHEVLLFVQGTSLYFSRVSCINSNKNIKRTCSNSSCIFYSCDGTRVHYSIFVEPYLFILVIGIPSLMIDYDY